MSKAEKRKYKIRLEGFPTPKSHEEFIELLKDATNDEYEMVSRFSMMNGYGRFIHKECGSEFRTNPYKLLIEGEGCPSCKDKINIKSIIYKNKNKYYIEHSKFTENVFKKYSNEFVILSTFTSEHVPVKVIHTKCGEIFKRTPSNILGANIKCPKCNPMIKWNLAKIKKAIKDCTNDEFIVVSNKYITIDTPIEIKHKICGEIFLESPNSFIKTPKCGICEKDMSLNEKYIKDFFIRNNIDFEREYTLDGCKNIQLLYFDFAVFKSNKLVCLLEYDGEQHYRPVFDKKRFIDTQISDGVKNRFCKDNKIKLIRIPFWEADNLEKILKNKMKELKVI